MHDDLGDRMKENYEDRARYKLLRRMPVIVRLDGKAFHTFCKRFDKPFDARLHDGFHRMISRLCHEVSGIVLAEHHSDEVSLLLFDYADDNTQAYFDYSIQKLVSVVAGIASAEFCKAMLAGGLISITDKAWPSFDCRAFNIPKEEVGNYFWWRNRDSVRNSIAMVAQSKFSHKQLDRKNTSEMQEMLYSVHGVNWAHLPQEQKSGWWYIRGTEAKPIEKGPDAGKIVERSVWITQPAPGSLYEHQQLMPAIMALGESKPIEL